MYNITLAHSVPSCAVCILTSRAAQFVNNMQSGDRFSAVPTSGAVSPSELSACLLGVTVTSGAEEERGIHKSQYVTDYESHYTSSHGSFVHLTDRF